MANKPSSLLDDADFGSIGQSKSEREKAKGGGGGHAFKIVIVVVCFVIAGLGLAWNFGAFEPKQLESSKPGGRGALSTTEQEAAKKQQQQAAEDMTKPDRQINGG
jgi:hypothetical protein